MILNHLDRNLLIINSFLFISSCILTVGALYALPGAVKSSINLSVQSTKPLPVFKTEKITLTPTALNDFATSLNKSYPGVNASVNGDKIKLSITEPYVYSRWQAAIGGLLLMGGKDIVFETISICGLNCSGLYCLAEFRPQQIKYILTEP